MTKLIVLWPGPACASCPGESWTIIYYIYIYINIYIYIYINIYIYIFVCACECVCVCAYSYEVCDLFIACSSHYISW